MINAEEREQLMTTIRECAEAIGHTDHTGQEKQKLTTDEHQSKMRLADTNYSSGKNRALVPLR
jgi:hypothetical protein